jgi:hypothetical protein
MDRKATIIYFLSKVIRYHEKVKKKNVVARISAKSNLKVMTPTTYEFIWRLGMILFGPKVYHQILILKGNLISRKSEGKKGLKEQMQKQSLSL